MIVVFLKKLPTITVRLRFAIEGSLSTEILAFTRFMPYFPTEGNSQGYYLYVESSAPASANNNAKLRSPWLNPDPDGQCLKFFYSMYGGTMGELMVQIELEGKTSYLLFYENGDKGIGWKGATKNIDADVRYRVCTYISTEGTMKIKVSYWMSSSKQCV